MDTRLIQLIDQTKGEEDLDRLNAMLLEEVDIATPVNADRVSILSYRIAEVRQARGLQ